jgi:hypothetical protein
MKIMAKQVTNMVSTIKLPDGQCTQTGGQTLKLVTVHFLDSTLNDDSYDCTGAAEPGHMQMHNKRGDWNLARNVINQ